MPNVSPEQSEEGRPALRIVRGGAPATSETGAPDDGLRRSCVFREPYTVNGAPVLTAIGPDGEWMGSEPAFTAEEYQSALKRLWLRVRTARPKIRLHDPA